MANATQALLRETGFDAVRTERYLTLEAEGRTDECARMLRRRRCELVDALHEAQRPIDLLDWALRELDA